MGKLTIFLQQWGKTLGISVFLLFVFLVGTLPTISQNHGATQVLGASIHVTPTPTVVLAPTSVPVTIINNIIVPTGPVPSVTPLPTSVQAAPTPIVIVVTPTPTPGVSTTPTPTLAEVTPTPTPAQTVNVIVDYAGERPADVYSTQITAGETGWQAVQSALGLTNLHYTDYGGSLGIFITGFNGIDAGANQYYDFQVNGASSNVGVSSYTVQNGDTLRFVLTSF